eukprot:7472-Heterococcus_DN1.PRE.2
MHVSCIPQFTVVSSACRMSRPDALSLKVYKLSLCTELVHAKGIQQLHAIVNNTYASTVFTIREQ